MGAATRIKMPSDFGERAPEKADIVINAPWDLSVPHVFVLRWDVGGLISVFATEAAAARYAAHHLLDHFMANLKDVDQEHEAELCECECHASPTDCTQDDDDDGEGTHDHNENGDCINPRKDCPAKGKCCVDVFDGTAMALSVVEKFQQEDYVGFVSEWNDFFERLYQHTGEGGDDASMVVHIDYERIRA